MLGGGTKLSRIEDIPPEIASKLSHIRTCEEFLMVSPLEMMNTIGCSYSQYIHIRERISTTVAPSPQNVIVLSIYTHRKEHCRPLLTTLHGLDKALGGGIPPGTITEVAAPSGCGKTQFCLMLSVLACMPETYEGLNTRVLYIDTEGTFSAQRFVGMARARFPLYFSTREKQDQLAGSVFVFQEMTCEALNTRLKALDEAVAIHNAGLVIVDSIASLLRKEYDTRTVRGVADRSSMLSQQAMWLKFVAQEFQIPIVVTNQITTHFASDRSGGTVTASLGNTWSHCVNTRIIMDYWRHGRRRLSIIKSPLCGRETVIASLEEKGFVMDWQETNDPDNSISEGDPTTHSLVVKSDITS